MNNAIAVTGSRLQKAIDRIKDIGLSLAMPDVQPIVSRIQRIEDADPDKALVIARTLAAMQAFDALVAENLEATDYGDRFNDVASGFNSIIDDAKRQVTQEERGGPGLKGRIDNILMKLTRGDIADRFRDVEKVYRSVIADSGKTLDLQRNILEAYVHARMALKEGEIAALEIFEKIKEANEEARQRVGQLNERVKSAPADMPAADRGRLELERDEALNEQRRQDDRYQIAKELSEMLTVSYSVTETIFGRYSQAHQVLDRLHQKAVIFFDTQRPVMTALKATYTGLLVVNELSKTQTAMEDGLSRSLETLATLGDTVLKEGVRAAHGPGIRSASVKMLVESTVSFQLEVGEIVREQRELSTAETVAIRQSVEEGKRRVADFQAAA